MFRSSILRASDLITREFICLHEHYAQEQSLESIDTVIIYLSGNLLLLKKGANNNFSEIQKVATPALEEDYLFIKSITHVSVSFSLILQDILWRKQKTIHHLKDLALTINQLARLKKVTAENTQEYNAIELILDFIHKTVQEENNGRLQCIWAQYLQQTMPIHKDLASQASELQLKGIHKIVTDMLVKNSIQLNQTRVLIPCAKGPREGLIEEQYFQWLYLQQGIVEAEQKNYIFCVEMLPEQIVTVSIDDLLSFLKKHQLNTQIGKNLLRDTNAMNKDILGNFAPDVLANLCPIQRKTLGDGSYRMHSFFGKVPEQKDEPNTLGCIKKKNE